MYADPIRVDDIPYLDGTEMLCIAVVVYSWVAVVDFEELLAFQLNHISRFKCPSKVRMIDMREHELPSFFSLLNDRVDIILNNGGKAASPLGRDIVL
jgi:hypothetical protein